MSAVYFFKEDEKLEDFDWIGKKKSSDFILTSKATIEAQKNILYSKVLENKVNNGLQLSVYHTVEVNHLIFTYLVYPNNWKSLNQGDRKYFARKDKRFYIDILFPDFERFCNADKDEALRIMAEQTLRGAALFLPKVKGFDFTKFYSDLSQLFRENGLIE